MEDVKPALICAAVGFGLSVLIGLFSGVHLLALLVRGALLALVFGVIGFGSVILLKKFLPELFTNEAPSTSNASEVTSGVNVNIVLDDKEATEKEAAVSSEELPEFGKVFTETNNETSSEVKSFSNADAKENTFTMTPNFANSNDGNTLDELPDLKGFEDAAESGIAETTSDLVDAGTESMRKDQNESIDPANVNNMARAIHTILKKETT